MVPVVSALVCLCFRFYDECSMPPCFLLTFPHLVSLILIIIMCLTCVLLSSSSPVYVRPCAPRSFRSLCSVFHISPSVLFSTLLWVIPLLYFRLIWFVSLVPLRLIWSQVYIETVEPNLVCLHLGPCFFIVFRVQHLTTIWWRRSRQTWCFQSIFTWMILADFNHHGSWPQACACFHIST